jgi:hypothetical protein
MSDKTIIEVSGVKLEVDLRTARRVDEMRIGDRVKVLKKHGYGEDHKVFPGVVVGFEPFQKLPTIIIAYINQDWSKAELEFLYFNAKCEAEVVHAADLDFHVDRDEIIARFDREIAGKRREIEAIEEKRHYFETNFRAYWQRVERPAGVEHPEIA